MKRDAKAGGFCVDGIQQAARIAAARRDGFPFPGQDERNTREARVALPLAVAAVRRRSGPLTTMALKGFRLRGRDVHYCAAFARALVRYRVSRVRHA
jgi:hypothetical protein